MADLLQKAGENLMADLISVRPAGDTPPSFSEEEPSAAQEGEEGVLAASDSVEDKTASDTMESAGSIESAGSMESTDAIESAGSIESADSIESLDALKETRAEKGQEYLTGEWGKDLPENHGIMQEWLEELDGELQKKSVHGAVLIKDGSILYEYQNGLDTDYLYQLFSCSKSITSAAAGVAIEQGYLGGLESKVGEFFPQIANEKMKEVTLEQLLNFTSGIDWAETTSTGKLFEWIFADNQVEYILQKEVKETPGEKFQYNSGNSHLVSAILTKVTGMSEHAYVKKNIFEPIGIGDTIWGSDFQGITFGGFGLYISLRDAARFGQLYLNGGKWGEQQVIPEEWVKESTRRQAPDADYGYNWWLESFGAQKEFDMYYAAGYGGQYIFVVPKYQIVAVVTSGGIQDMSVIHIITKFLEKIG